MRNLIFGGIAAAVIILVMAIVFSLSGKMIRQHELNEIVARAAKDAVQMGYERGMEEGISNSLMQETGAYLAEDILSGVQAEGGIELYVRQMDLEKGLLSVMVKEEFVYPNGKSSSVSAEKIVIANRLEPDKPVICHVRFYVDDFLYKEYEIQQGDQLLIPEEPAQCSGKFKGWAQKDTGKIWKAGTKEKVEQDYEIQAVYEKENR